MIDFKKGDRVRDSLYPRVKGTITAVNVDSKGEGLTVFSRPYEVRWDGTDHRKWLMPEQVVRLSVIDLLAELVDE